MKKTWMLVKRGINTVEHRILMGKNIWLFLHMLDRVDWETGIIWDWQDSAEADYIQMPVRTLRYQRQSLEEEEYIKCKLKGDHQEIMIFNYVNPRKYDGEVLNPHKRGYKKLPPWPDNFLPPQNNDGGDNEGYNEGSIKVATPTLYLNNQNSSSAEERGKVVSSWESLVGTINGGTATHLWELLDIWINHQANLNEEHQDKKLDPVMVLHEAIKITSTQADSPNTKYTETIMQGWMLRGFKAPKPEQSREEQLKEAGYV